MSESIQLGPSPVVELPTVRLFEHRIHRLTMLIEAHKFEAGLLRQELHWLLEMLRDAQSYAETMAACHGSDEGVLQPAGGADASVKKTLATAVRRAGHRTCIRTTCAIPTSASRTGCTRTWRRNRGAGIGSSTGFTRSGETLKKNQ